MRHVFRKSTENSAFLVLSLPRSRSAWLSRFLSYGDWYCGHEELRYLRSFDDVDAWFSQPCTGSAETAAAPWWRLFANRAARIVTIRRPVDKVVDSLLRIPGCHFDRATMETIMAQHNRKLDQIEARVPGVLSVPYADLASEAACARIFEHVLPYRHDHDHWAALAPVNIQCNMPALTRYAAAYAPAMNKLGRIAKHRTITNMAARKPVPPDGMTFQAEDFETWVRDARDLFNAHLVDVGEAPGDWQRKNIPLMQRLYDAGAMQIMTARSNGRMFGYLMTLFSPSLTSESLLSATNLTFYASPDAPGIGMKLQRAALAAIKERGAGEVFWEAGKRGSGPRIDAIYRRLGAVEHGTAYRLELAEAA